MATTATRSTGPGGLEHTGVGTVRYLVRRPTSFAGAVAAARRAGPSAAGEDDLAVAS